MDKDKLGPVGTVLGTISFLLFGLIGYVNIKMPGNLYGILFGLIVGLLFGFISKLLFTLILSLLNLDLRKQYEKGTLKTTVSRSTIFMFPYALMAFLAAWLLNWMAAGAFFSAAVMNTGVMISVEMSKLRKKAAVRNTISTIILAGITSSLWLFAAEYLKNGPLIIEGAVNLVSSLMGVGK